MDIENHIKPRAQGEGREEKMEQIYYRSPFRGWVPVTIEQARRIAQHLNERAVAVLEKDKGAHIAARFRGVTLSELGVTK